MIALTDCRIFTGEQMLENHAVLVSGESIQSLVPLADMPADAQVMKLNGHLLAPGFIDVHVNGGGGALLNDTPDVATVRSIAQAHRRFGTTALLPTLITDTRDKMDAAIRAVRDAIKERVPGVLGIHLEGPYLNTARKGVHRETVIRPPEQDALDLLCRLGKAGKTLVTLAPERVPASFIEQLVTRGVIVSAGHTAATYDEVKQALALGVSGFTHLFNAMSPMASRAPGVVGAALEDDNSWCGLIVDGHHVHPATLKVAVQAKARGKMMLVTDAMHTVGANGSRFELMGQTLIRDNGMLTTEQGILAGSDLNMASAVRNTVKAVGLSLEESLRMASLYPARFLGLGDRYGCIAPGYRANLVLLNKELDVLETWIDGCDNGQYIAANP